MNLIVEMALPALVLSCLAGCALAFAAKAPQRFRFWISVVGLLAWLVPWPLIHRSTILAGSSLNLPTLQLPLRGITEVAGGFAGRITPQAVESSFLEKLPGYWPVVLLLPGILWFAYDLLSYRRTVADWLRRSSPDESLREVVPVPLKNVRASIQIVSNSNVAAATGIVRPAVWIGDRFTPADGLLATLTHELCHIRRKDPLRLAVISFVARVYCWNPFVCFFARQARFFVEASCDQDCARILGREEYKDELARLILRAHEVHELPRIVPTALTRSLNLSRVRLLGVESRIGMRLYIALITCVLGVLLGTALAVQGQNTPAVPVDDARLQAVVVWRNGNNGDPFWRKSGNAREDAGELMKLWERVGDHILIRKDAKFYYVNDSDTVKDAIASAREHARQTAPFRQRLSEAANAQMPPEVKQKLRDLQGQQDAIWKRLQPIPGGFGNPNDALFEQLDNVGQQSQAIQREQETKVMLQHPEWKVEGEKVAMAWILKLHAIADGAMEKGLSHPTP